VVASHETAPPTNATALVPDGAEAGNGVSTAGEASDSAAGSPPAAESEAIPMATVTVSTGSAPIAPAVTDSPPAMPTQVPAPTTALPAPTAAPSAGTIQLPLVNDGSGWVNESGQVGLGPGHLVQVGDGGNNEAIRGFLSFDLSPIPEGATVASARLILPIAGPDLEIQGQPFSDLNCLLLEATEFNRPLNATAYNDIGYPITCEDSPPQQVDVLIDVEDVLFEGLSLLQFRVTFEAPTDDDNMADLVVFRAAPQVEIVYTAP